MRALVSHAPGGPDSLCIGNLPAPSAGAGQLLVDIAACAINYPDTLIIEDRYQIRPPRPFAPGGEVAGTVAAVGEGVGGFAVGDRVIALCGHGGLAEQVAVPATSAFALPAAHDFVAGSALLMTYGTAIHALNDRAGMKQGETLLVLGAAGGVGIAAMELGKAFGARVVAAVSSEEKAAVAREAGADAVVVYPRQPIDRDGARALSDAFKAAVGPGGADVICDAVGGDYSELALRCIGWGGRFLVIGFPAGIAHLPLNLTLLKSCDVRGVFWGAFALRDPKANQANIRQLFALWDRGLIRPRVTGTCGLDGAADAIAALAGRRATGKLVVTI